MPLPEPILTFALTLPSPANHAGEGQRARYRVTPSDEIIHAATGDQLLPAFLDFEVEAGESREVTLPHPVQPGMIDPNGADIINWHYVVTMSVLSNAQWTERPGRRIVQPLAGTTAVNIALVPLQEPVRPAEKVTPADRALIARDGAEQAADRSRDYANDADLSAGRAATYVTEASEQADRADEQRQAAELAAGDADAERVAAQAARAGSEVARTGAEAARDIALTGQFLGQPMSSTVGVDLNTLTTPGVYRFASTSAALATNIPHPSAGILEVFVHNGVPVQRYTPIAGPHAGRLVYLRAGSFAGAVWRPVTAQRVDQSAGRAIYTWDDLNSREQLIYGDTGWRNVSASLVNGWKIGSGGIIHLRRVGSRVMLAIANLDGSAATSNIALPSFAGFGAPWWVAFASAVRPSLYVSHRGTNNILALGSAADWPKWNDTGGVRDLYTWPTDQSWPTALPGVPSGGIPNA